MLRSVEVEKYMLENPATVAPDADLFDAVQLILDNRISGLCVVNKAGDLVGVLSELDCLNAVLSAMYDNRTNVGLVKDYMTTAVIASTEREDIVDVAADMLKNRHRRRPVVRDGKLVGQITCRHLLEAVRDFTKK